MAKSRITALLLALAVPGPVSAAEPLTAERAMDVYRQNFESVAELDCPRAASPEDIVVCGRRPGTADLNRLPLPVGPEAGRRERGAASSMAGAVSSCIYSCPPDVGLTLTIRGDGKTKARIIR